MTRSTSSRRSWIALPLAACSLLLCQCFLFTEACGPLETPPDVDWTQISTFATNVFAVSKISNSDDDLESTYTTGSIQATVRRIEITGDRYMVLVDGDQQTQTIYVPGTNTDDLSDIIADLEIEFAYDETLDAHFHEGFLDDARDVHNDVTPLLQAGYRTTVVGYSLGGATAVILSMYLDHDGYAVDQIVTFGQPKVTNAAGVAKFGHLPLTRFKAAEDGVPDLPPGFAYEHFGSLFMLLDGPYYVYLSPANASYWYATSFLDELADNDFNLNDHGSYPDRAASKVGVDLSQVAYCDRAEYIDDDAEAEENE